MSDPIPRTQNWASIKGEPGIGGRAKNRKKQMQNWPQNPGIAEARHTLETQEPWDRRPINDKDTYKTDVLCDSMPTVNCPLNIVSFHRFLDYILKASLQVEKQCLFTLAYFLCMFWVTTCNN